MLKKVLKGGTQRVDSDDGDGVDGGDGDDDDVNDGDNGGYGDGHDGALPSFRPTGGGGASQSSQPAIKELKSTNNNDQ